VATVAIPVNLTAQNWLITPAVNAPSSRPVAVASGAVADRGSSEQLWLLVLTGVGAVELSSPAGWFSETVTIVPDVQAPLSFALDSPVAPLAGTQLGLNLVMWAPFVAVSTTTTSQNGSISGGYAMDVWRPTSFDQTLVDSAGNPVRQVFQGVNADISVQNPSEILGLSYNIRLLGRIVRLGDPVSRQQTSGAASHAGEIREGG
jgi:hypothetical protein